MVNSFSRLRWTPSLGQDRDRNYGGVPGLPAMVACSLIYSRFVLAAQLGQTPILVG